MEGKENVNENNMGMQKNMNVGEDEKMLVWQRFQLREHKYPFKTMMDEWGKHGVKLGENC